MINDKGVRLLEESIQTSFGKCIRLLRIQAGLSQEKFALKIDMDRTYYASVENGHRNISLENIKKISDGLAVPISEIFQHMESERNRFTNAE